MASPYERAPTTPSSPAYFDVQRKPDIEVQSPTSEKMGSTEKVRAADGTLSTPPSLYKDRTPPERKYSRQWFEKSWNRAVRVGRLPRVIYAGVGICIIVIWFGIMLAFNKDDQDYRMQRNTHKPTRPVNSAGAQGSVEQLNGGEAYGLQGSYLQFDSVKHTMTVTWSGIYLKNENASWVALGDHDDKDSVWLWEGIGIYRDVSAIPWDYHYNTTSQQIVTNGTFRCNLTEGHADVVHGYMYRVDNLTAAPVGILGKHKWDSFDTEISFVEPEKGNRWNAPLVSYPFDVWEGSIVFSAVDIYQNGLEKTPGGNGMELAHVKMRDATLNWRFNYTAENTCWNDKGWDWTDFSTFKEACNMEITFRAERPPVVKFAAVSAVIVNWTSALFIFVLTCEAIVMRRRYMLEGTDILSVCFTALFALPTIRALLPGAPEYGATLDLVGVLPCTVLVALCTVAVAIAKLNKRKHAAMGSHSD